MVEHLVCVFMKRLIKHDKEVQFVMLLNKRHQVHNIDQIYNNVLWDRQYHVEYSTVQTKCEKHSTKYCQSHKTKQCTGS